MIDEGMGSDWARDLRTVPNVLTLSRIVLVVAAMALYVWVSRAAAIAVGVVAGVTDYLDGIVARRTGQVTRLGEILDQWSDLCYESMCLTLAVAEGFLSPIVLVVYLLREFWVTTIRRHMAGRGLNVPSSLLGKLKTNFLMWGFLPAFLSIGGFLPAAEPYVGHFARGAILAGLVLSYASGWAYTRAFFETYERGR
jgi:CDP-diacylglycerol--glycerol-3-phosphate 3-phosphatidyltransferase